MIKKETLQEFIDEKAKKYGHFVAPVYTSLFCRK